MNVDVCLPRISSLPLRTIIAEAERVIDHIVDPQNALGQIHG